MTEVQLDSLTLGEALATGGQGTVFALKNQLSSVFKQYHNPANPEFNEQALAWLVAERTRISFEGRAVDEWAAWPSAVVKDGAQTVGFLMRRVPAEFTIAINGQAKLADLSFLASKPRPLWAQVPLPSDEECVQLIHHLAGAMRALHQRSVVIGDISFLNVVWARTPSPRVMLLDCDGMRRGTDPPVLPQAETLDWEDPLARPNSPPTIERDRYKLALAVMRVLTRDLEAKPTPTISAQLRGLSGPSADRVLTLLRMAAGPLESRPSASDWIAALSMRDSVPVSMPSRRKIDSPPSKPELLGERPRSYRPVQPPSR